MEKSMKIIERSDFSLLFAVLKSKGFIIIGPTSRDGAIIYDEIQSVENLPVGWSDEQDCGKYRLRRRNDEALFGYAVGPHSWKKYLHVAEQRLWSASKNGSDLEMHPDQIVPPKLAFLGVRSCELHAIAIQDKVLLQGPYEDDFYSVRRKNIFIIAVNCTQAGGTCFCASMKTGPRVSEGFDLALTEVLEKDRHYFVVEAGTENGKEVLAAISKTEATEKEKQEASEAIDKALQQMRRTLDTEGLKELLYRNYDNPRWDHVAKRCLSCANCTIVCPTCFCTTIEDVTDLSGNHAERRQKWDSCFHMQFSYIHGGSVRASAKSRYRQWMTHKLATWQDQFGSSGCVGCGRCITWCPVGIDITEEAGAIRQSDKKGVLK